MNNALGNMWQVSMPGPETSDSQELLNPVIAHVPLNACLTIVSSSGGTVNCGEGSIVSGDRLG